MAIEVFPNPTNTGIFSILLDSQDNENAIDLRIYNYTGKLMHTKVYAGQVQDTAYEIELPSNAERGVYLIHINQNGYTKVAKFILN